MDFISSQPNKELLLAKIQRLKFSRPPDLELDIKSLQGRYKGFYRLRIGKIRILFYKKDISILKIHKIGFRGDIY